MPTSNNKSFSSLKSLELTILKPGVVFVLVDSLTVTVTITVTVTVVVLVL